MFNKKLFANITDSDKSLSVALIYNVEPKYNDTIPGGQLLVFNKQGSIIIGINNLFLIFAYVHSFKQLSLFRGFFAVSLTFLQYVSVKHINIASAFSIPSAIAASIFPPISSSSNHVVHPLFLNFLTIV